MLTTQPKMPNEFSMWYNSVPPITRYWFTLSVAFPLLGRFGLVNPQTLIYIAEKIIPGFQLWRLFTSAVYFPLSPSSGMQYLINIYFLYNYSRKLEEDHFAGRKADYAFMLCFNWLALCVIAYFLKLYLLMPPLVISVIYVWCQLNKDVVVQFWFGTRFRAIYLPWVLAGFNFLLHGGGFDELMGILVGHLFYFLMFQYPQEYGGASLLHTPWFFYKLFPLAQSRVAGFGAPPTRGTPGESAAQEARRPNIGGHNWGGGQRLDG